MTLAFIAPVLTTRELTDAMDVLKGAGPAGKDPISLAVALHASYIEQTISRLLPPGSVGNPTETHYGRDGLDLAIRQSEATGSHRLRIEVPIELTGDAPHYGTDHLATFKPLIDRVKERLFHGRQAQAERQHPQRRPMRDPRYDWGPRKR